jgi:hypothetical protein
MHKIGINTNTELSISELKMPGRRLGIAGRSNHANFEGWLRFAQSILKNKIEKIPYFDMRYWSCPSFFSINLVAPQPAAGLTPLAQTGHRVIFVYNRLLGSSTMNS